MTITLKRDLITREDFMYICKEVNMPQNIAGNKFPEGWIKGLNPVLDKFLDEVASRKKIADKTLAILHIKTFFHLEKRIDIDPYEINEVVLIAYGKELEEYLVKRWKSFSW